MIMKMPLHPAGSVIRNQNTSIMSFRFRINRAIGINDNSHALEHVDAAAIHHMKHNSRRHEVICRITRPGIVRGLMPVQIIPPDGQMRLRTVNDQSLLQLRVRPHIQCALIQLCPVILYDIGSGRLIAKINRSAMKGSAETAQLSELCSDRLKYGRYLDGAVLNNDSFSQVSSIKCELPAVILFCRLRPEKNVRRRLVETDSIRRDTADLTDIAVSSRIAVIGRSTNLTGSTRILADHDVSLCITLMFIYIGNHAVMIAGPQV